jgi:membrane associated rhomboid family serine protease
MVSASSAPAAPPSRSPEARDRIRGLTLVIAMVALMWVLEAVDALGAHLDNDGIHPRDVGWLPGIAFAPFLHAGWGHLIGNTIPFLILGFMIALGGLARTAAVTVIVVLVAGFGTWLIGPAHTNHIGASGVVFGFATYLVARGIFSRRPLHLVVGLGVLAIYGTTLAFALVPTPGISWQGHLFGAIGGIVAAWAIHAATRRTSPAAS